MGNTPYDLDAGDIDDDGKLDLVVACLGTAFAGGGDTGHVKVLMNTGSGFDPESDLSVGTNPMSVRFVQLNPGSGAGEDDHLDFVVGRVFGVSQVKPVLGDGTGSGFTPGTGVTVAGEPWFLTTGDMTEDDRNDVLAVGSVSGSFSVLPSAGDGTLASPLPTSSGVFPRSLGVADFDDDDHLDVAVMDDQADAIRIYDGRGDGTFATIRTFTSQTTPLTVIPGHWNSDGDVDLATANVGTGDVKVYTGDGEGAFALTATISGGPSTTLASGDFNEDDDADLVWADTSGGAVKIATGNGDGTFDSPSTVSTPSLSATLVSAGLFTVGDAHADLAAVGLNGVSWVFRLLPGNGDGTFGTPSNVTMTAGNPTAIASGDLTGDGQADFVVTTESGNVQIVEGTNGDEVTLGDTLVISEGTYPRSAAIADLDGDGDLDIAVANSDTTFGGSGIEQEDDPKPATGWVSIFRNNGSGTFAADDPVAVSTFPWHVAAADLNGDGYPDLSVSHLTDLSVDPLPEAGIDVLISDAQGGFLGPEEYEAGFMPFGHAVLDVDDDDLNDAVVADAATSTLYVLRNYLQVAMDFRATPKRMLAKKAPTARPPQPTLDGVRLAAVGADFPSGRLLPMADVSTAAADYAPYWYHNDHLGTPQTLTDETRQVVWQGYYRPFGEVTTPTEEVVNNFRFPGQYHDSDHHAAYNYHRYFAAQFGRYLSADALVSLFALPSHSYFYRGKIYTYGSGNPLGRIDYRGLDDTPGDNRCKCLQTYRDRLSDVEDTIGDLENGTQPIGKAKGVTNCFESGPITECPGVDPADCLMGCYNAHEATDRQQCLTGNWPDDVIERELPGYRKEKECLEHSINRCKECPPR